MNNENNETVKEELGTDLKRYYDEICEICGFEKLSTPSEDHVFQLNIFDMALIKKYGNSAIEVLLNYYLNN